MGYRIIFGSGLAVRPAAHHPPMQNLGQREASPDTETATLDHHPYNSAFSQGLAGSAGPLTDSLTNATQRVRLLIYIWQPADDLVKLMDSNTAALLTFAPVPLPCMAIEMRHLAEHQNMLEFKGAVGCLAADLMMSLLVSRRQRKNICKTKKTCCCAEYPWSSTDA